MNFLVCSTFILSMSMCEGINWKKINSKHSQNRMKWTLVGNHNRQQRNCRRQRQIQQQQLYEKQTHITDFDEYAEERILILFKYDGTRLSSYDIPGCFYCMPRVLSTQLFAFSMVCCSPFWFGRFGFHLQSFRPFLSEVILFSIS